MLRGGQHGSCADASLEPQRNAFKAEPRLHGRAALGLSRAASGEPFAERSGERSGERSVSSERPVSVECSGAFC